MKNPNLLTRSSYTFFNSLLKIQDIIDLALNNDFSNAFLIDKNIMYGSMDFYLKCIKNNIKPIIGLQIDYKNIKTILIAKNFIGYQKLMEISSNIQLDKQINLSDKNLFEFNKKIEPVLYKNKNDIKTLKNFNSISGLMPLEEGSTHFLTKDEFEIIYGKELYEEISLIIDEVNIEIKEKKNILPLFFINNEKLDSKKYLEDELKIKLKNLLNSNKNLDRQKYIDRTSFEFTVISKMKFESYFLIVSDIVNWSKKQGIFVGPGRGSAPGSIISYLLNITTIDPIENNLLFERFLNPDRISMPDIDIDFEDVRRDEVINYIVEKYGENNVAQIITYQTLRARMSFKDIARIKGLSSAETNIITKLIPEELTLEQSYKKSKIFAAKINESEINKEIFEESKLIEGLPRQFSTHAAGIVISNEPIYKSVPVQKGYGKTLQTQYSMDFMEYNGLLKIDILGLRNLSFIKESLEDIEKINGIKIDLNEIKFNDSKIYKLLSTGKTSGVFQLDSPGMKAALKEINVSSFEDVVATSSLFRPGPMKMISEFASRKKGEKSINYINEKFKKILEPTYGIIVYQEQIMQIVQIFSNFELSKADILRRAIGKKDIKLLTSLKDDFFDGARKNGYEEKIIQNIYDLIYEFSSYGFNRSHAFAYTIISYWLAWLKINYPIEFMKSLLNSFIGNAEKTILYISETKDLGIKVNEPSIFHSNSNYEIYNKEIYIGLRTIKKIGDSIIKKIEILKENINKKMDILDLFIEFEKAEITSSVLEILIKANVLREFGYNKETLLKYLFQIEEYLKIIKRKENDFVIFDKKLIEPPKLKIFDSSNEEELFKEVMGFSMESDKLLEEIKIIEKKLKIHSDNLNFLNQDQEIIFIGKIISIREITTKTGSKMAFLNIDNGIKKINVTFWPATFQKFNSIIKTNNMATFYGKVDLKRGETIIINKMEKIQ